MSQEWLVHPERSSTFAMRSMVWVASSLGRGAGKLLLYPACGYFLLASKQARAASRAYLARALGREPSIADSFRHYYVFATTLLDRIFLLGHRQNIFDVHIHGEECVAELLARAEGGFLLGAHVGSFEVLRALEARRPGLRVRMVMYEENARKISAVLAALSPDLPACIIALGKPDSMLKVTEALNRGEFVGMLGDRALTSEGQMRCEFFGRAAAFPTGPFRMAAMLKRPLVLMFGLFGGANRYDIYFERLTEAADFTGVAREALIEQWLKRYVRRLEHYCRLAPYNWFNFYDFWN